MLYSIYLLVRKDKIKSLRKISLFLEAIDLDRGTCTMAYADNLRNPFECKCLEVSNSSLFIEVIGTYEQIYCFHQDMAFSLQCKESWDYYFDKPNTLYYLKELGPYPIYLTFCSHYFGTGNRKYFNRRDNFYSNGFFKIEDIKSIKKNTEDMRPILMDIFDEELDRRPDFSLIYFI